MAIRAVQGGCLLSMLGLAHLPAAPVFSISSGSSMAHIFPWTLTHNRNQFLPLRLMARSLLISRARIMEIGKPPAMHSDPVLPKDACRIKNLLLDILFMSWLTVTIMAILPRERSHRPLLKLPATSSTF